MKNFLKSVLAFLAKLVPWSRDLAHKVAPEVQAQIDAIRKAADAEVDALTVTHSAKTIQERLSKDITDAQNFAARHIELLKAAAEVELAKAEQKLPNVLSQLGVGSQQPST